jgi:hypothetical protein
VTTIAYRDGVLAADTGMTIGGSQFAHMTKIARNKRGDLAGGCGMAPWCCAFLKWFMNGEKGAPPPIEKDGGNDKSKGFIARARGGLVVHESDGTFAPIAPYYAIGSGRGEAIGAMFAGASAELAVRAAIAHDESTFGDVTVLRHEAA